MAINISTDVAVTTGGKLTDIGSIQGGWKSVSTYSDMAALTGSATLKGKLQNGQVFYVVADKELYSLSITGNAPFQTYTFSQFEFPMTSSVGGSTDISALNTFTGSIQSEVDSLTSATSSYILVSDTSSMSVFSALTASYIDPTFISASAAASGFGEGLHTDISALNTFTGSIQTEVDSLTSATSSYALIADISGAFASDSASFSTRIASLENFAGGGDITSVIAGAGLSGGSETGDATITLDTSSTHFIAGVSASAAASGFGASDWNTLSNIPSGIISSSDQITITESQISDLVHTDISSLNTFSGSVQSQVDALIAATSSYLTSETDSQTLSIVGDQLSISNGNTITIPTGSTVDTSSFVTNDQTSSMSVATASYAEYAVSASYEISYEVSSSYADTALTASYIDPTFISASAAASGFGEGLHTDITDLNNFTGSIQTEVDSLTSATSSYLTAADTASFLTELPSGVVSGSQQITDLGFIGQNQTSSMSVATASYIDPSFISASAAASGFGAGGGIFTPTGSVYATTNNLEITGSLTVSDGVLRLSELSTTPTAEPGAIFYSASNFYFGVSE